MLNIALEDTVIICSKEYNSMKVEMKTSCGRKIRQ